MFAKMFVAVALVVTSASTFASDVSSERRQAFRERPQMVERRAASVAAPSAPAKTAPALTSCTCTK